MAILSQSRNSAIWQLLPDAESGEAGPEPCELAAGEAGPDAGEAGPNAGDLLLRGELPCESPLSVIKEVKCDITA